MPKSVRKGRPTVRNRDPGDVTTAILCAAVTGQMSEDELVMVKESEEQEELESLQRELAERDRLEREAAGAAPPHSAPSPSTPTKTG
jgi:TRAP-type transport system small permease protein